MKPRLVRDSDLDIRPMPQKRVPSPAAIERTLSLPSWWVGAIHSRQFLGETGRGLLLCGQIESALAQGESLSAIPAFAEWRQGARR